MPKNALESIDFLQSDSTLRSLFDAVVNDFYVRGSECRNLITKDSVRCFLDCFKRGVLYAVGKWGQKALPRDIIFSSMAVNERRSTHDKMWFHGVLFSDPAFPSYAEVGITYYFVAKMIAAGIRGRRYYNDHIPEGYYVDIKDGIALCAIEECRHTFDFNEGKLQRTTVDRDDISEVDIFPIIAEAIRELAIPLYPHRRFENIVYIA